MNIEQIPISLLEKIPLDFMPWHPYIENINENRVIFRFSYFRDASAFTDRMEELGGLPELVHTLKKEFVSFAVDTQIEYRRLICTFKEQNPA